MFDFIGRYGDTIVKVLQFCAFIYFGNIFLDHIAAIADQGTRDLVSSAVLAFLFYDSMKD
jgi:hypothetical protein